MIGFSAFLQTLSARLSPILRPPIYDMPRNSHMQTFLKIVSPHAPVNSLSPASSPLFRATGTIRNRRKTRRNTVGKDRPVTFNRYILFRMVVEFVGAIACAIQMFQHHTWPGIITMGVFALVWAIGEIWLSTVYNRAHPPPRRAVRRASGNGHPFHVLRACGGAGGIGIRRHDRHAVQACAVHRSRHGVANVGHAGPGHRRRPLPVA